MTASGAFAAVAESAELTPKQVKTIITSYIELAAAELKKNAALKLASVHEIEEASQAGPQGHQSFHKGAMCFQCQASEQDCEVFPNKEIEGSNQLRSSVFE